MITIVAAENKFCDYSYDISFHMANLVCESFISYQKQNS